MLVAAVLRCGPKAALSHEATNLVFTMVDLATRLSIGDMERAITKADKRGLIDPDGCRSALEASPRRPGVAILRALLDRTTLILSDSELEGRVVLRSDHVKATLAAVARRCQATQSSGCRSGFPPVQTASGAGGG